MYFPKVFLASLAASDYQKFLKSPNTPRFVSFHDKRWTLEHHPHHTYSPDPIPRIATHAPSTNPHYRCAPDRWPLASHGKCRVCTKYSDHNAAENRRRTLAGADHTRCDLWPYSISVQATSHGLCDVSGDVVIRRIYCGTRFRSGTLKKIRLTVSDAGSELFFVYFSCDLPIQMSFFKDFSEIIKGRKTFWDSFILSME